MNKGEWYINALMQCFEDYNTECIERRIELNLVRMIGANSDEYDAIIMDCLFNMKCIVKDLWYEKV